MTAESFPGARVNAPVPRRDARAPAVILLGLAGAAALALVARRRRPTGKTPGAALPPTRSRRRWPAVLAAGAVAGGGALAVRRIGVERMMRAAPLVRYGVEWLLHPHPLLPGDPAARGGKDDLVRLRRLLAGDRQEQVRFAAGILLGGLLAAPFARSGSGSSAPRPRTAPSEGEALIGGARRQLHLAAALLGVAVLADSGLEHYRACFENPAMYTPLVASSLTILANGQALIAGEPSAGLRNAVHLLSGAVGIVGLGFHFYNIGKRPGGYSWLNFFYGAPFGAPAALTLAALIGFAGEQLDAAKPAGEQRFVGLPFGPAMAVVVSGGLVGTVAEVGLLHFRGAFHNPFMWLPVSLPPVAALLMAKQALAPGDGPAWVTRGWLWTTVLLGIGGVGFHAYGVSRNMGGWYNWSQNILAGPPLPAPPSFSALALAGLAVLDLIEAGR